MPPTGNTTTKPRSGSSSRGKHENEGNPDMSLTGIGNYVFEKTIGQGNFAKVKLAKHKLTDREVAIKIIDKTTLDEKKLSKLHREVRIMKMLNHPNIVKLFEVIETKYTLFLVMEYVAGGELYDYLVAHGRMKEKDARAKFRQILSAVHYCHRKRVIHRDLKAENLLLDENLNIKIADFGFSNSYAPEGQLDTFCGSPPYAAPELFQGRKYTGPEVDIWSLGVILYVLCTGCLPFDGKDLKEMREVVCRGRYKVPFYLSDPCEKLLRKFLVRDPTKRATLEIVKNDVWLSDGYDEDAVADVLTPDALQKVDEEVVYFMVEKFNITAESIVKCLDDNMYDDISAIYFLLVDQKSTGKWAPLSPSAISPIATSSFQAGTQNPISKPTPMGTIGEEGDGGHPKIGKDVRALESAASAASSSERRDRSHTFAAGASRQRPVTWMANNDAAMQNYITDNQAAALENSPGSGPKLANGALLGEQTIPNGNLGSPANSQGSRMTSGPAAIIHARTQTAPANQNSPSTSPSADPKATATASQAGAKGGVIGAIRSLGRRLSESTANAPNANQMAAIMAQQANGEDRPRSLRFTFNSNTTSTKPPPDIVKDIVEACQRLGLKYVLNGKYMMECTWYFREFPLAKMENAPTGNMDTEQLQRALAEVMNGSVGSLNTPPPNGKPTVPDMNDVVRFEIEVCELPRLKNLHGLRFRRIGGPSTEYKDICGKILASLHL